MFLMLVISSVRMVRITSDMSSSASDTSLKWGHRSTTVKSLVSRRRPIMRRIWSTVISSAISGLGGASRTLMPVLWLMSVVSTRSSSVAVGSATTSMMDLFLGFRFSSTPTSPNWN